jgi:hypothetical protein
MSAFSPYTVEILFIRAAGAASSTDDSMRVRKNFESGEFELVYKDSHDSKKQVHTLTGLYRQRVLDHVYLALKNLTMDEDNFFQVQLNMPAMPPVLVSVENLSDVYYRDHLLELVGNGLDNLDVLETVKYVRPPTASSAAVDEYADMPPLISHADLQAQQQNARRVLTPSMDNFLDSIPSSTRYPRLVEQRRSARLAQRCNPCTGGGCSSSPRRHMFFNQNEDEDDEDDY